MLRHGHTGIVGRVDDDAFHQILQGERLPFPEVDLRSSDFTGPGGCGDAIAQVDLTGTDLLHHEQHQHHLHHGSGRSFLMSILRVQDLAGIRLHEQRGFDLRRRV